MNYLQNPWAGKIQNNQVAGIASHIRVHSAPPNLYTIVIVSKCFPHTDLHKFGGRNEILTPIARIKSPTC